MAQSSTIAMPSKSAALALAGLMTFGMYAMMFLVPIYLQSYVSLSAARAGLALLPLSLAFVTR